MGISRRVLLWFVILVGFSAVLFGSAGGAAQATVALASASPGDPTKGQVETMGYGSTAADSGAPPRWGTYDVQWLSASPVISDPTRSYKDGSRVIKDGSGIYHIWTSSFIESGGFDNTWRIDHFTSTDLIVWTFADTALSSVGGVYVYAPDVAANGGTYYMFYVHNDSGTGTIEIDYATATSPNGPWTAQGAALQKSTNVADWDYNQSVYDPSVLNVNGTWTMYYAGGAPIGRATATTLAGPWTRQGIVLNQTRPYMEAPAVISLDGLFQMWFTNERAVNGGVIGHALSADGATFGYAPDGLFLEVEECPFFVKATSGVQYGGGSPGIWDGGGSGPAVIFPQARISGNRWGIGAARLVPGRKQLGIRLMTAKSALDNVAVTPGGSWVDAMTIPVFVPTHAPSLNSYQMKIHWQGLVGANPLGSGNNGMAVKLTLGVGGKVDTTRVESEGTIPDANFGQARSIDRLVRMQPKNQVVNLDLWYFGYVNAAIWDQIWDITF